MVAPDVLLTAANCHKIFKEGKSVIVGAYKVRSIVSGGKIVKIAQAVTHHHYKSMKNDMMLLHIMPNIMMYKPVQFNFLTSKPSSTDKMKIIGFGLTSNEGSMPKKLQWTPVPLVPVSQ